ncbi:uncharacterized protein LUBEL isoform X2 [Epargyreus clarus]|uniref:uncharacterized protein LUBEL isoform X2 n=1 Tax=Epargyreus clarus TaxID=520877 RepID=UPI003C2D90E9
MLKNRGREPRTTAPSTPLAMRSAPQRPPLTKPEPDYEVVEFPSEQYVNAKLQPPPPPPPRPPTNHPLDAGASCGLCGGGGARVRCTECGRRALCASCDDMYHRHPKRRHHQRQALSQSQLRDERPPLPPKATPPVPPPRRHKIGSDRASASPRPLPVDPRRTTLSGMSVGTLPTQTSTMPHINHFATQRAPQAMPMHPQANMTPSVSPHVGSMPYLPSNMHHPASPVPPAQDRANAMGHFNSAWGRPQGSLQRFNMSPNMVPVQHGLPQEPWDGTEQMLPPVQTQNWGRPLRRGASVMELGGAPGGCGGCAHCAGMPWRYGSCAALDHPWPAPAAWPACCPPHAAHLHPHVSPHPPHTPQPYRRAESRAASRAASRAGSRAASPAMSVRSRTSRRPKHRTPSPPPLPSSDADSESENESYPRPVHPKQTKENPAKPAPDQEKDEEDSLGPAPPPPDATWQCEHCTFVNEPGVRVCVVCCRTPTVTAKIISDDSIKNGMERLKITEKSSPTPSHKTIEHKQPKQDPKPQSTKEKVSTGCGPSPPREEKSSKQLTNPLATPTKETAEDTLETRARHDIAVGPSPPKEIVNKIHNTVQNHEQNSSTRASPYRAVSSQQTSPTKHSISVGPSPPREMNNQNRSARTSPPRQNVTERILSSTSSRTNVSNTGTSPPPQTISTQTYEVPSTWERAPSASRSRPRRRFRDDVGRERSHSRHSLSSDTRESERSIRSGRTSGGGRWEWREVRDSSPAPDSEAERRRARLTRRASHLDLRRARPARRSSLYGSEAPSPEPLAGNRAISLEALAGSGAKREAERGLELARLMSEAERLGFSAAEVHAALAQNPIAPLSWLSERWPSLCAGVRAAAARLAPGANITELEARAALARHRGAMWPAVTECVERSRRQAEDIRISEDGRMRGHVWGSPNGVDDDAAPPLRAGGRAHRTREESSDEFEVPTTNKFQDDDWMYLPLDVDYKNSYENDQLLLNDEYANATNNSNVINNANTPSNDDVASNSNVANINQNPESTTAIENNESATNNQVDIAEKLKILLMQAGIPSIDENLLLKGLLSNISNKNPTNEKKAMNTSVPENKNNSLDFTHFENDFINAYNELTRSSPLPNVNNQPSSSETQNNKGTMFNKTKGNTKNADHNFTNKLGKVKSKSVQKVRKTDTGNYSKTEINTKLVASDEVTKSTPPINRHILQSPDPDVMQNQNSPQEEEKSENLRDMVDNTARLIQQMKNEIHSDINSLDERSKSRSEEEISSNESNFASDEDSNYSHSQSESEDLSSDDKKINSSDEETNQHSENQPVIGNRTSSEDNEQFEEAMDHLDNQIEDFKQTNIEILDSIAKSLQEEHTFSLEVNGTKENRQDLNNNLFDAVNSFDEIYEQLNNNKREMTAQNNSETKNDSNIPNHPEKPHKIVIKQSLNMVNYNPEFPTKVLISENKPQLLKATMSNIEQHTITMTHYNPEIPTRLYISENKLQTLVATVTDIDDTSEEDSDESEVSDDSILQEGYVENKTNENNNNNEQKQPENSENQAATLNTPMTLVNEPGYQTSSEHNEQTNLNQNGEQSPLENKSTILIQNNLDMKNDQGEPNNKVSKDDPSISNEDNKPTKTSNTNKSNIPKLIKSMQNNKTKSDKTASKVIASKVPVRRGSLKQYPAPTPPKSHFGNVQSGHVKQLQNQLFNSKQIKTALITPEVKATTSSTLNKKKPAPLPPLTTKNPQQPSSPKSSSPSEKKDHFFRETCRTEDEWTDSDSDEYDQRPSIKGNQESEPTPAPSTPQPITLRRISGQFIDLAHVQLPEGSPERQARMLLAEGATENWEQAQLAVELISRGTEPPAALLAALECTDLSAALAYLQQDCELCASKVPEHEMVSMLRCTHRCCRECARLYFTVQVSERSIADCVCPYCKEPELENLPEDSWLEYFAHLDIQLKTLLDPDLHELFQRKLRDRTLAKDPNFRWCVECSSGFFVHPKQKKLRCPECKSISCATCRKPWSSNHEGLTCDQYTTWLEDNDPERSVAAVQQHLRENGLECPRCHFKYSLSRGGCMHFTCTQCKYEFCYGCGKPFMMGARCGLSEYCARLGLHAHHPRNCLFYLRDKEPHELQTLLQMNNVSYETEAPEGTTARCAVQLQRETPTGLVDSACGSEVLPNQAGLCKNHYLEYLSRLVRAHNIDPLPILGIDDLETLVRRAAQRLPPRPYGSLDGLYKRGLTEIVRDKIPLD